MMTTGSTRSAGVSAHARYLRGCPSTVSGRPCACPILTGTETTGLTYNQLNTNLVSQAATMNTHGLPNDILSNLGTKTFVLRILKMSPHFSQILSSWSSRMSLMFATSSMSNLSPASRFSISWCTQPSGAGDTKSALSSASLGASSRDPLQWSGPQLYV